jgi:plasmid stabilization system protein ParE
MKVLFAPAAKLDLLSIAEHVGQENPTRAVSFDDESIRRCVYGNYLIFYRVREEAVDIVHILHGATDYESLLFPDA